MAMSVVVYLGGFVGVAPLWLGLLHLLMDVVDYGLHWMVVKEVASCLTSCTRVFLGDGSCDLELLS